MLNTITSFIASVRQKLLMWRVEWEIYRRIFPHLNKVHDGGYSFESDEGLWKAAHHGSLDAKLDLATIERQADEMGKAYGDAFRYIMYRDINRRLAAYRKLMRRRVQPATCDARFVATRA